MQQKRLGKFNVTSQLLKFGTIFFISGNPLEKRANFSGTLSNEFFAVVLRTGFLFQGKQMKGIFRVLLFKKVQQKYILFRQAHLSTGVKCRKGLIMQTNSLYKGFRSKERKRIFNSGWCILYMSQNSDASQSQHIRLLFGHTPILSQI